MAYDPGPSPRSAHRGLGLSGRATIAAPVIEDPPRHPAGSRRGLRLGDWADVAPLVEGPPRGNAEEIRPRSLRPDALNLIVGVGVAGVVIAQAVLQAINVPTARAGMVLVLLQASGPVFVTLLTLMLLHACRQLRGSPAARFWINCVAAAVLTYVVWSAVYFIADGGWRRPFPGALGTFAHNLLTGTARAQLGLVFVSVQLCVVLPLVRWVVRVTRGVHRRVLVISFALQLALSAALYWASPVPDPARLLPSYVLFVVAGALLVDHQGELGGWSRHLAVAGGCVVAGVLVAEVSYGINTAVHATPDRATQAVQPAVTIAGIAALIALFVAGALWEGRRHPWWQLGVLSKWSDASTGVYLTSPLLVQVELAILSVLGLGARSAHTYETMRIVLGLGCGVPLLLTASWLLTIGLRHSPASVALTGRRRLTPGRVGRRGRMAVNGTAGLAGLAILLAVALPLSPRPAGAGQAMAGSPAHSTTTVAPVAAATDTTMHRITVDGLRRTYEVVQPQHPVSTKLPVLVFLHGTNTKLSAEENRGGLLPLATAGQAILVYPSGVDESWNDGACCSFANRHGVDDVAFLTDVVRASAKIHGAKPNVVDVVGYGDGGKMTYHLVCQRPRLAAGAVVIAAVPAVACPSGPPVPLLQVAGNNDPVMPYQHAVKQVGRWVKRDGCQASPSADVYGELTLQRWSACSHGTRVEFATYTGAGHDPFGGDGTPTLARVMISFVGQTPFIG